MHPLLRNIRFNWLRVLLLLPFAGCSVSYDFVSLDSQGYFSYQEEALPPEVSEGIGELTDALQAMSPEIRPQDATLLAKHAYLYPMVLANEWELTKPPMWQNALRNNEAREGGLCTDWTHSLLKHFNDLPLKSFDFYWAVAFQGRPLWEHSTVVATPKGEEMNTGIILDPWRNSGELYWIHVTEDPKFPWKQYLSPAEIRARNLDRYSKAL